MLLPTVFESIEDDYWHLCEHVQVWDVSCERQIEIRGTDSQRLVQMMTPRDIKRAVEGQGLYTPVCGRDGGVLNDPVLIKLNNDHWWFSIADSDIKLWSRGLASGFDLDVEIAEASIWPLAVQGPKAEELVSRVFGEEVRDIRFFRSKMLKFRGREMMVARSGYSRQGGFEIYLNDANLAEPLWDELFKMGQDLNVKPGGPNLIERIESGLISYGNDVTDEHNPFECGLDTFIDLDADIESLSLPVLREISGKHENQLVGLSFDQPMEFEGYSIKSDNRIIAEISSHVWSPRYGKHLAMAMMKRDYLAGHSDVVIDGQKGIITDLPFTKEVLNSATG
jgi:dimethylsulfoniopropionate demethylase